MGSPQAAKAIVLCRLTVTRRPTEIGVQTDADPEERQPGSRRWSGLHVGAGLDAYLGLTSLCEGFGGLSWKRVANLEAGAALFASEGLRKRPPFEEAPSLYLW